MVVVAQPQEDGKRIDVVLATHLSEPRARTQQRLDAGEVSVGGTVVAKSHRVHAGQQITVAPPAVSPPPAVPPPVPVRYRDEHLAVVVKPAGLVVHAGSGVTDGTLVDALLAMDLPLARTGDPERPGLVHRLDRGTSGLLAVALSDDGYLGLTAMLRDHDIERRYSAVVDGVPDPPRATVDAPIARSTSQRTRFAVAPDGRPAVTHYDVVEAFARAALLDVALETGRTHQVRVHLAAVGHPLTGDVVYGANRGLAAELGFDRPALHARRLAFRHPVTGVPVEVEEPLPEDLLALLEGLRGQ